MKNGNDWFSSGEDCSLQRKASSKSNARKAASAAIAKIPLALARHIARVYYPKKALQSIPACGDSQPMQSTVNQTERIKP